ncbi:MAG: MFS transporter [Shinella zoogloeoides]|uniref:MFS transporter n=1 Tax=Shinella zoogloeoides TaxID=352475 RepID=UPI003C733B07
MPRSETTALAEDATSAALELPVPRAMPAGLLGRVASSLILYPRYRLLWVSNLFFFAGVWTQTLVLGWLVFEMTGSEFSVAIFTAARLSPLMLGPLAGVISDRFNRPRLLLVASGWAFCVLTVVALLVALDRISFLGLVAAGFCIGLAQSPSQPARFTLVSELVGRRSLSNANALNSIVLSMTQVIGPALGGAMIAAFGAAAALAISALWYLVAFLALWPLRQVKNSHEVIGPQSLRLLLSAGFSTVLSNRLLGSVLLVTFAANILLWPIYQGFMPVIAKEHLGLSPSGLGWLLACAGTGGLAGSVIVAALGDFRYKGGLFVLGTAIWGALWAVFALCSSVPLSFALMVLIGLAAAPFGILQTTLMLMMTEPHVQGRVMGIQELTIGVMPLASIMLGAAAEAIGITHVALISGTLLATFLALLALRVPALLRYSGHGD